MINSVVIDTVLKLKRSENFDINDYMKKTEPYITKLVDALMVNPTERDYEAARIGAIAMVSAYEVADNILDAITTTQYVTPFQVVDSPAHNKHKKILGYDK